MSQLWVTCLKPRFFQTQRRSQRRATASAAFQPRVEQLEHRLALATVSWVGGASGNWAMGSNWSTGALPDAGDDVVIAGTVTVTHAVGSDTVNTISVGSGATLQVTGNSFISTNSLSNAGSVLVGPGSALVAAYTQTGGTTTLQGGTLANFGPPPGNSLSLNGSSDFVQVASSPSLDSAALTSQATMEAWIYLKQLPSAAGHIMSIVGKSEFGNDLDLQVQTDNRVYFYAGDQFPNNVVSNTVLQAGRWYHVAATFQAGTPGQLQIFVNGVLDATAVRNLARNTNPNPLTIGESAVFGGRFFNGLITDVSVWNVVQTSAQIQTEMTANLSGTEAGLVGAWTFSEGSGLTAHDLTANHNDGALSEPDWIVSPVSSVNLQGGSLSGTGTISGNVVNGGGSVVPGDDGTGGTLSIVGGYSQESGGTLDIEVGGSSASGTFGQLAVSSQASLGGTFTVTTANGYVPLFSDSYAALTFSSESGNFATYNLPTLGGEPLLSASFVPSGSPTSLVLTGSLSPTTTALTPSANPSIYGQAVTLTATVTAASGNTPTGTVDFQDQTTGQDLGTVPLQLVAGVDQASVVVSGFVAGTHAIVASYTSDHPGSFEDSDSPSLSQVVNQDATTTTVAAQSQGLLVTLSATVGADAPGSGTPTGTIDFQDTATGTDLGSVSLSDGSATLVATILGTGQAITATYSGDTNFLPSSGAVTVSTSDSVYVLNTRASAALNLSSNAIINFPGTVVVDSNSSAAATAADNSQATASSINVIGGVHVSGKAAFHPAPVTGAAFVPDPLDGLGAPAGSGPPRGSVIVSGSSSLTISPGIYTSISVSNGAHLTLMPGIYVITGSGFQVADSGSVSGSGVLISDAGGSIRLKDQAAVNLTPQTTGAYAGIVFFQPANDGLSISLSDNAVLQLNGGLIYAPAALLNVADNAQVQQGSLIVNQLHVSDNGIADDPQPSGSLLIVPNVGLAAGPDGRLAATYPAAVDALLDLDTGSPVKHEDSGSDVRARSGEQTQGDNMAAATSVFFTSPTSYRGDSHSQLVDDLVSALLEPATQSQQSQPAGSTGRKIGPIFGSSGALPGRAHRTALDIAFEDSDPGLIR
jgi:hypothetical protein